MVKGKTFWTFEQRGLPAPLETRSCGCEWDGLGGSRMGGWLSTGYKFTAIGKVTKTLCSDSSYGVEMKGWKGVKACSFNWLYHILCAETLAAVCC